MRVLHLIDRLAGRGGAYTHLLGVASAQVEAGHEVTIAGGPPGGDGSWPCPVRAVPGLEARTRAPVALDKVSRDTRPDLVHVHTVVNPRALEWAGRHGAVATIQDHRYFCAARGRWTLRGERCTAALARDTCAACFDDERYFDEVWRLTRERLAALQELEVVVLSRYMRDELVTAGLAAERVHVVPPFVHGLDTAGERRGDPCILFVGRLTEAKGVRPAIEAWRRSGLGLPLVIAGTGPLREWARDQGAEVLGWVDRERLRALYQRAAALLMPPLWQEPFGIAGLEALAFGVPVAAWRSGGIPEWHPGDESLAEWGDVGGLTRALVWCHDRRASAAAGFDRPSLMRRLDEVYRRTGAERSMIFSTLR